MEPEILETLEEQTAPEHTALLVIDPQNDFLAPDGAVVRLMGFDPARVQAAVPPLNQLIEKARDRGIRIVWTQSFIDPARATPNYKARGFLQDARKRNLDLVVEGSRGSDWYSGMIKPLADEVIIRKYHYDAFSDTNLDLLLRSSGIKTLLLTGFMANVCVETAARHAYILGYYVVVVGDCTEAATRAEYESTLYNIGTYFGKTATSEEIVSLWEKG